MAAKGALDVKESKKMTYPKGSNMKGKGGKKAPKGGKKGKK